jgi:ketosteroid isomerase-like protein
MSQQNVEIVRRVVDQFNGTGDLDWEMIDPDAVWVLEPPAFLAGTYRGHEGIRALLRAMAEVFDRFRLEVEDLVDAGDSVVGLGGFRARGALSGAEAPLQPWSVVVRLRNRRIVTYTTYYRREDALEAAGLREYPGPA